MSKSSISQKRSLRPTTGKVREAVFNILRDKIDNARFLDLYAGTGAVGVEALNKGASEAVFVETIRSNTTNIKRLIEKFDLTGKSRIISQKAVSFIDWAELNGLSFDIIFLDPPYHTDEIIQILSAIGKSNILKEEGIVIAEHFAKRQLPDEFGILKKVKDYVYGDSVLSFFVKNTGGA